MDSHSDWNEDYEENNTGQQYLSSVGKYCCSANDVLLYLLLTDSLLSVNSSSFVKEFDSTDMSNIKFSLECKSISLE